MKRTGLQNKVIEDIPVARRMFHYVPMITQAGASTFAAGGVTVGEVRILPHLSAPPKV
ncbi:hypothetical protein MRS76_09350 [Rhizobiaceae bacterium n13]|uniref:Uncharacterized protein n=1 Tax=Ferirhizobium litorale TaxID=2927786 RepID=A0AAE3QG48_9HYPH|nr:hypothetical protein [Fererhizobium litorale]MDI7862163.1 hypothetical protein [Fererhizobium litorale]MDI7922564.1 hypothetical protein [Fererhizobium litorale]